MKKIGHRARVNEDLQKYTKLGYEFRTDGEFLYIYNKYGERIGVFNDYCASPTEIKNFLNEYHAEFMRKRD